MSLSAKSAALAPTSSVYSPSSMTQLPSATHGLSWASIFGMHPFALLVLSAVWLRCSSCRPFSSSVGRGRRPGFSEGTAHGSSRNYGEQRFWRRTGVIGVVMLLLPAWGCGPGEAVSRAPDLQRLGTKSYSSKQREEVSAAAVAALRILGYDLARNPKPHGAAQTRRCSRPTAPVGV